MTVYDSTQLDKKDTVRLNEIAENTKSEYATVLDEYYAQYGAEPFWWFLPLAIHSGNYDDTFYKVCLIILIIEKISAEKYDRIITDKFEIKRTLDIIFHKQKRYIRVDLIRASSGSSVSIRLYRFVFAKVYKFCNDIKIRHIEKSLHSFKPNCIDVLIWGPLLLNKINGKEYEDGYFSGLNEICSKKFYYFPYLIYNTDETCKEIINKVNSVNTYDFIHMSNYHRWYDFIFGLRYLRYCLKLKREVFLWGDYDISPIIHSSIDNEIRASKYMYASECYVATKRLVKQIPIRKIILWYESRPVDIAISLAIRDAKRDVKVVGYIGYSIPENFMGESPTKSQFDNLAVPEIISVPGRIYERMVKRFEPRQKTIIVPAFRVQPSGINENEQNISYSVFILLPYFSSISHDMIHIVNDYCRKRPQREVRVLIKMHPAFAGKEISEFYDNKLYFEPEYTTDNIYECLKKVDIAFTSSSSASMDVIMSGTYLICLSYRGQLRYTCIGPDISDDRYSIIFDEEDFEKAMEEANSFARNKNISKICLEDYYTLITKENVELLFD